MYKKKDYTCKKMLEHQCNRCFTRDGKITALMFHNELHMFCDECKEIIETRQFRKKVLDQIDEINVQVEKLYDLLSDEDIHTI